jgi:hypothetical protein
MDEMFPVKVRRVRVGKSCADAKSPMTICACNKSNLISYGAIYSVRDILIQLNLSQRRFGM